MCWNFLALHGITANKPHPFPPPQNRLSEAQQGHKTKALHMHRLVQPCLIATSGTCAFRSTRWLVKLKRKWMLRPHSEAAKYRYAAVIEVSKAHNTMSNSKRCQIRGHLSSYDEVCNISGKCS
jgi:hypothetical protein